MAGILARRQRRGTWVLCLGGILLQLLAAAGAEAHVGTVIYPLYEIPAAFPLDLHDGSVEEEIKRLRDAQAQMYVAIAASPTGRLIYNLGAADPWVSQPPYVDVGGFETGAAPKYSLIEGAITPWDQLQWPGPQDSRASALEAGRIIGIQFSVPDFDMEPGQYQGFHALLGSANTWRLADNFADGILLCADCDAPPPSAVRVSSWARIKAGLR